MAIVIQTLRNQFKELKDVPIETYSDENIRNTLETLLEADEIVNDELFLVHPMCFENVCYKAPPVLMAMCIGEYELGKKLIEKGYPTATVKNGKIEELKGYAGKGEDYFVISLGQYLLGAPDMSEDFRIYLWRQIAQEKQRLSKTLGVCRGKVIDFSMISFRANRLDICNIEQDNFGWSEMFECTVRRTIQYIAEQHPKYLKNTINKNWTKMFVKLDCERNVQLVKLLLEKVIREDKSRIHLLHLVGNMVKIPDTFSQFYETFPKNVLDLYEMMLPHYRNFPDGKKAFSMMLIVDFIETYNRLGKGVEVICDDLYMRKVIKIIKSLLPEQYSFNHYAQDYVLCLMECPNWCKETYGFAHKSMNLKKLIILCRIYVEQLGYAICLNDDVGNLEEGDPLTQLIDCSHWMGDDCHKPDDFFVEALSDWSFWIHSFEYCESDQLNRMQKVVLHTQNYDFIQSMLEKGLLQGKYVQMALDYCMEKPNMQSLIPCILAYEEH